MAAVNKYTAECVTSYSDQILEPGEGALVRKDSRWVVACPEHRIRWSESHRDAHDGWEISDPLAIFFLERLEQEENGTSGFTGRWFHRPPGSGRVESAGAWVDMEDQATLDALSLGPAADILPFTGQEEIDRAAAFSNDRNVTTRIAEWLRGVTLDDGSELAGVKFKSRVGNGACWAYWMRRADLGLTELVQATAGVGISSSEPAMAAVTEAWEIRSW